MLILASKSKIRQQILSAAGVTFIVRASSADEKNLQKIWTELSGKELAAKLAETKAQSISRIHPNAFIIGSDQTAQLEGHILHKAKDVVEARQHLLALRGKTHKLHSAFSLIQNGNILCTETHSAQLTMRHFTESFLDTYMQQTGETLLSSVGCYQLEGPGLQLFDKIEGDYFTILGLPLLPLLAKLREIGELDT
jgi:septum formation protein